MIENTQCAAAALSTDRTELLLMPRIALNQKTLPLVTTVHAVWNHIERNCELHQLEGSYTTRSRDTAFVNQAPVLFEKNVLGARVSCGLN